MSRFDEIQTQFVIIEREQLARLKKIATQLYREDRLSGDQMRDMGHTITGVLGSALPFDATDADASVQQRAQEGVETLAMLRSHLREVMLLTGDLAATGRLALGEIEAVITIVAQRMTDIRKEANL